VLVKQACLLMQMLLRLTYSLQQGPQLLPSSIQFNPLLKLVDAGPFNFAKPVLGHIVRECSAYDLMAYRSCG